MQTNELVKKLNEIAKGRYIRIKYASDSIKPNAENKGVKITKIVECVIRFVRYDKIKGVVVSGKTNENETIIVPNYVKFNSKTGNTLVLVATTNNPKHKGHTTYLIDNVETTFEKVAEIAQPSSLTHKNKPSVYTIKAENIISIGE